MRSKSYLHAAESSKYHSPAGFFTRKVALYALQQLTGVDHSPAPSHHDVAPLSSLSHAKITREWGSAPIRVRGYTISMSKDVSFQLDIDAASVILTEMVAPLIKQSGTAIAARAQSMANSMSSDPPEISVVTNVITVKRGRRAVATITATGNNSHQNYIGHMALLKARDAGRV